MACSTRPKGVLSDPINTLPSRSAKKSCSVRSRRMSLISHRWSKHPEVRHCLPLKPSYGEIMARVLIVDDSPTEMYKLTAMLEKNGHVVLKAENGADGVAQIGRESCRARVCQ